MEMFERNIRVMFGVVFCALSVLVIPAHTYAAQLYFEPDTLELHRGDTAKIALRIDTDEDECINTVDAVITYDSSIRAVDVSRGNSILSLWVEDPVINETDHTITFAGGIPGGYCGRIAGDPSLTNIIAEIVFRSPGLSIGGSHNPTIEISFDPRSQVLLHNGYGTPAPLRTGKAILTLLDKAGPVSSDEWTAQVSSDDTPPADFVINLFRDATAFSGKYFLSFNSVDKQSGIDHYEVIEEPLSDFYAFKWGASSAPWSITESPYVLRDQTLNSTIRVKAIDKAGNETVSVLVPEVALRSISHDRVRFFVSVGIGVLLLVLVSMFAFIRFRKKKSVVAETDTFYE